MRVLHVLHHSLPVLSGYSIRSDNIVRSQHAIGVETASVTAAQHAADDTRAYRDREISGEAGDERPRCRPCLCCVNGR
jgi:hypothetical protein